MNPGTKASYLGRISRGFVKALDTSRGCRATISSSRILEAVSVISSATKAIQSSAKEEDCVLEPCLPSTSVKPKLIHHVFRWGLGNAFRSHSKNRFRPTHAERNTAVCIPEDYFTCTNKFEHCEIAYDKLNEQWEVLWYEFGKVNGKPFPVKKFGINAAKAESIAFAEQLDQRLQTHKEQEPPAEPGLTFDHTLHCWVALGRSGNRPATRAYSAEYHGYNNARERALKFRGS